jgi:hypothetical protein
MRYCTLLDDKSTKFVSSRVHQFSHLESIEVYTTRHNVNLVDVLKAMESSKEKLPDDKDSGALKSYFEKVYPELDFDRVYASDLKKMVKWYSVLSKNQVEIKLSEPVEEEAEQASDKPEIKEEKPAKKATTPKAEIKAATKPAEDKKPVKKEAESKTTDAKPTKKAAEKKSSAEEKPAKKVAAKKAAPAAAKKSSAKPAAKTGGQKEIDIP